MAEFKDVGTKFDRTFRNTLNENNNVANEKFAEQKKRVDDLIVGTEQPSEVVDARGGAAVLRDRLDGVDSQLADIAYLPALVKNVDNYSVLQTAINYCITNRKKLTIVDGTYLLSQQLESNGELDIEIRGQVTIQATASMTKMINSTGKLTIKGKLTLDANSLAGNCIYSNTELPKLKDVIFKNSTSYCLENNSSTATGECVLDNTETIDCVAGVRVVGDSTTTKVTQINAKTKGTTGSGGNCYFFSNHNFVNITGGDFTGHANTGPNVYICNSVNIIGGRYHGIFRGATVGRLTKDFTIMGTVSESCSYAGIAVDLKDTDPEGTIPQGHGLVSGNVLRDCGYALHIQAKNIEILGNYSSGHTSTDAAIRINGGKDIFVDGNSIICTGIQSAFSIAQTSEVTFGKNYTNSTDIGYRTDNVNSVNVFDKVKTITASIVIRQQDNYLLVDATTGNIALTFPQNTTSHNKGKKWTIVRTDSSANNVTVAVSNGNGTINGVSTAITLTAGQYKTHEVISIGSGAHILRT